MGALTTRALTPPSVETLGGENFTWNALAPVPPGEVTEWLTAGSGSWTFQGASPHSKSPFGMPAVGVGWHADVV
jgi:hypothetical protein